MEGRDDGGGKVMGLIEKATKPTAEEVDPRLLKAIKSTLRYSDSEVRLGARTLMELMKHNHSQVFVIFFFIFVFVDALCTLLIDESCKLGTMFSLYLYKIYVCFNSQKLMAIDHRLFGQ